MSADRLPVFATRANYKVIETRLKNAQHGHDLLKAKSDSLQAQYRKLEERYTKSMQNVGGRFQRAFLLLSRAEFYGANVDIFRKHCSRSAVNLETELEQVCGVLLPSFRVTRQSTEEREILSSGGAKLVECKQAFDDLLLILVDIASIKNSYFALKQTLDHTNRRVNALEHMLIPRLEGTLRFISSELDEQERENFYRLKKIQSLNK